MDPSPSALASAASDLATIVIMARRPALGTVKTRLGERLSPEGTLHLYEAFLSDKVEQARSVPGAEVVVAVAPPDPPESIAPWTGEGVRFVPQRGADLGERLSNLVQSHFADGTTPLLVVDSDTPTLPPAFFEEALRALRSGEVDVVLGPAADGGYYLIGLRAAAPRLFDAITWSTSRVLSQTLERAGETKLAVHLLQSWRDVDTPSDLDALAAELAMRSPATVGYPARTARVLADLLPPRPPMRRNEHWQTVATRAVYQNRWMAVTESLVALPGGGHTLYGVVRTGPCVGILPFVDRGHVVLVRQFRYVAQRFTWEIPTGGVHQGESLEDAALRELREEAGVSAARLEPLVAFTPSKSVLDEMAHLFVARDLDAAFASPDETEELSVKVFALDQAVAMVKRGEIIDSMSMVALLMAQSL